MKRRHLSLLDQFGFEEIAPSLLEYQKVFHRYEQTLHKLKALSENEQKTAHRLDLIQFQFDEIQKADLKLNEDDDLFEEKEKLAILKEYLKRFSLVTMHYKENRKGLIGLVWSWAILKMQQLLIHV